MSIESMIHEVLKDGPFVLGANPERIVGEIFALFEMNRLCFIKCHFGEKRDRIFCAFEKFECQNSSDLAQTFF